MDYGKYKYERDIRQKEARKKQARIEVKEIKFRPKIDPHDYGTKKGHVVRFLKAGARVKVTIMFRGREMAHTELGRKILDRLVQDLADLATVDSYPKLDGRNMVMVLAPIKRQATKEASPEASEQEGRARQPAGREAARERTETRVPASEPAAEAEPVAEAEQVPATGTNGAAATPAPQEQQVGPR
jgi:translation initiation factor IF-3